MPLEAGANTLAARQCSIEVQQDDPNGEMLSLESV
jgi:hypothetical protein